MKFLRIKFLGELDDGFARNFKRFGLKPVAHFQIIEVALFHRKNGDTAFMTHCPKLAIVKERLMFETGSPR